MSLTIATESPAQTEIAALLAASDAFSAELYPPESRHGASLEMLLRPEVTFLVARLDAVAVGCGALAPTDDGSAEIKRMFVTVRARGQGVGRALVAALEDLARRRGIGVLRLETGTDSRAALALYRRAGFREREPFGSYRADPLSVLMEKRLAGR